MYAETFGPRGKKYRYCVETDFTSYDSTQQKCHFDMELKQYL